MSLADGFGIMRLMKDVILGFFATWNDAIVSISAVVTAISALVAVVATVKHWRDDKVRAVFLLDEYPLEVLDDGQFHLIVALAIVNAGKTPFTIDGVRFLKKEVAEGVEIELVDRLDDRLDQGASVKTRAHLYTTKNMVAFPKRFEIGLFSVERECIGVGVVQPYKVRPAIKRADGRVIQPETGYAGHFGIPSGIGGVFKDTSQKRKRAGNQDAEKNARGD